MIVSPSLSAKKIRKFRKQQIYYLLEVMISTKIYSKQKREIWYTICKDLYNNSMMKRYDRCKKLIDQDMKKF